ncbi:MAG: hypothetical protein HKN87_23525 [Saprospiraceae bacterium]|nr:hypothetical protein [Saprospiraceae bacterium]
MNYNSYWTDRGFPWEHDPGPPKNLSWARLFSETPNYRGISKVVFNREKFRWHFGPMYYRGRLKKNQVKILIIGQEGAQDESLSHRSFTGGTGGRMQYFLNILGINYHYLFLNTFVYPIFGQYSSNDLKWLAQNEKSPIAKHRFEIFDYVLKKNEVDLVVAVGLAAKETVKNWIISRGGTVPDGTANLSTATGSFLDPKTKIVGVLHPGGASKGGNIGRIIQSFQDAIDNINQWISNDSSWLPVDNGMARDLSIPYKYSKSPIPFRDFALGTCWRLGRQSTSSNRRDSQRSIQLFSKGGKYRPTETLVYNGLSNGSADGYSQDPDDYPYEPPVQDHEGFDQGPPDAFTKLIMGGKNGYEWPDFNALGVTSHHSLGYICSFRGRPDQCKVLILADQQSHDDLFTMRALTGNSGQKMQAFLKSAGIMESYCIIRTLPVDTLDLSFAKRKSIIDNAQVNKVLTAIMNKVLNYNDTRIILTFGSLAKYAWEQMNVNTSRPVIHLKSWSQSAAKADWQTGLQQLQQKIYGKDKTPTWQYDGERVQIPRYDLPYGVLRWQGSGGDRSQRAKKSNGKWSPYYYKWFVPDWVYDLQPEPISSSEQADIQNLP